MRKFLFLFAFIFPFCIHAQGDPRNILNRDSFPPFVKTVTMNGYLYNEEGKYEEPMTSRYFELDTTGHWKVRVETFSDGDRSRDSIRYNKITRTKTEWRSNSFEPGKITTIYNKDGTIKSVLNEPGQRDPQLTEYDYDQNERCIKMKVTFVESVTVTEYAYDELGNVLNLKRYSGSTSSKKLQLDYEEKYDYEQSGHGYIVYGLYYGAGDAVRVRDTVFCIYNDSKLVESKVEKMENGKWQKLSFYEYDQFGRLIHEHTETTTADKEQRTSNKSIEYDSLGYYRVYIEEETTFGFSNRWTTIYNEKNLPVECFYQTAAEVFYYKWEYVYR